MENKNIRKCGRPRLNIDKTILLLEIEKYKKGQKATETFRNLGIRKDLILSNFTRYGGNKVNELK